MSTLISRITIDPVVCHGKPCVRGLGYPVETLLELLSAGMATAEILADYEDLERENLLAVLAFAAMLAQTRRLQRAPSATAHERRSWSPSSRTSSMHSARTRSSSVGSPG